MSLPEFPTPDPCLTRDQAINMILTSIAMEEIALSHVIEAESEKIKYALDYLKQQHCCGDIERILEVNESASKLMENVLDIQMILKKKMDSALSALPKPCPPPCPPRPAPKPERDCCGEVCCHHKYSAVFAAKSFIWCCGSALSLSKKSTGCVDIGITPSRDGEISLPNCKRFIVNFNLELALLSPFADPISVELRLSGSSQIVVTERYHAFGGGGGVTVSGSTIVETPGNCSYSYLCMELLSPCSVQVQSGRISIVEL